MLTNLLLTNHLLNKFVTSLILKTYYMTQFNANSKTISTDKSYPCPNCKNPTVWKDNPYKPFCSERCKLIDLGAWANEEYRVAADDSPFSEDLNR